MVKLLLSTDGGVPLPLNAGGNDTNAPGVADASFGARDYLISSLVSWIIPGEGSIIIL